MQIFVRRGGSTSQRRRKANGIMAICVPSGRGPGGGSPKFIKLDSRLYSLGSPVTTNKARATAADDGWSLKKNEVHQFRRRNKSHRGGGLCHTGLCFKCGVGGCRLSLLFRGCGLCCDGGLGGSEKEGKRENYRVEKMCKAKDDY